MLTRKSSVWSRSRMLLAIPVLTLSLLCFSKNAFSDFKRVRKGNKETFNGNEFELKVFEPKKMKFKNPETGQEEETLIEIVPFPIKINNQPLPDKDSVDKVPSAPKELEEYMLEQFTQHQALFAQLADGNYDIRIIHFVIGKKGEVLYFLNYGVRNKENIKVPGTNEWTPKEVNPVNVKAKIDELMDNMAANIRFTPAMKNGNPVPCLTEYDGFPPFSFTVKDHVASVVKSDIDD